jgi:acyl-CoA synthetase (AMP-forming)/AMP-acid ligase II
MLYTELTTKLLPFAREPCVIFSGQTFTYGQIRESSAALGKDLSNYRGRRVATYLPDSAQLIILLLALDAVGAEAWLISRDTTESNVSVLLDKFSIPTIFTDQTFSDQRFININSSEPPPETRPSFAGVESKVVIFTSGTSGAPKGAAHTWRSLSAAIKRDPKFSGTRWLLTYGLTRFAGLQVFLQAFLNGGYLVIPKSGDLNELTGLIEEHGIENVSGTPTFWRKLLTGTDSAQLARMPLKQITLGGETVNQAILNALRAAFPQAQITHIYASTEMGVCFSVKDGLEGFPAELLSSNESAPSLKVEDGELFIRSRRAMEGYIGRIAEKSQWFPSGDFVELRGNRVFFLGRKSDIINVGGSKVYPAEIEEQISAIPGVLNVRVFGQRSSFAGQLVSAEVIPSPDANPTDLRNAILEHCARALPPLKRPRLINFVSELKESDSRKILRQQPVTA